MIRGIFGKHAPYEEDIFGEIIPLDEAIVSGNLLTHDGRAIRKEFQGQRLASVALDKLLEDDNLHITAAAGATRNPAVPKVMARSFATVSPDVSRPDDPLYHYHNNPLVRYITDLYARRIGADVTTLPFTHRYGEGLYGASDPGKQMPLAEIRNNPGMAVIAVAVDKKERP